MYQKEGVIKKQNYVRRNLVTELLGLAKKIDVKIKKDGIDNQKLKEILERMVYLSKNYND